MSAAPATARTLQPSAWRRIMGPMIIAVIVLSVLLQEPVSALFPADMPRWVVFCAIAVPVVAALVVGVSAAYPRVMVGVDGMLRVRGSRVATAEVVSLRRSVSRGSNSAYLVYRLGTASGRHIRVLVAGTPIRGLRGEELATLRDVIAGSGVPVTDDSALERSLVGQNVLATGRSVVVDRRLALREIDALLGMGAQEGTIIDGTQLPLPDEPIDALHVSSSLAVADDDDVEHRLTASAVATRRLRRVALVLFLVACLTAFALLVVLVVVESLGTRFGAADEDPLTATMSFAILAALLTGILWGIAADVDDARRRGLAREWLDTATAEQLARGLPSPFHAAWMRAPGGRMAGLGLLVLGMVAMLAVIGGPVALAGEYAPPVVGIVATVVGVVLASLALWAWFARRRAHARRVEWLVEVAGARVRDGD